jgi:MYXO-CTERM domain-containing protein
MRHALRSFPVALALVVARPAAASDPNSIYTVPSVVEILPDDATGTKVVIGGSFFFLSAPMSFTYGEPRCGYMSFQCPPGKEVLCRMQWLDLRKAIGGAWCAGFGTLNMISTAKVHDDRASLGTPDAWDLGMGISLGSYVDGKCGKAHALVCAGPPPPPPDAAPAVSPDAAAAIDAAVVPPDAGSAPTPDAGAPPPGADADVPPAADAAAPPLARSDGCAVGGGGGPGGWPLGALLLALALGRRARRR